MMKKKNLFTKMIALVLSVIMVAMTPLSYDLGFADGEKVEAAGGVDYSQYEYYDELTNSDWTGTKHPNKPDTNFDGTMPPEWTMALGQFVDFTPSEKNTTGSFVWKFKYTPIVGTGNIIIYPFASKPSGVGNLYFNFLTYVQNISEECVVEIGVLKRKDTAENQGYDVIVKVNDTITVAMSNKTRPCPNVAANCNCNDPSNHTGLYFYPQGTNTGTCTQIYEEYDVLSNADWKLDGDGATMPDDWTLNETFIDFRPSTANESGSFIWNFDYECIDATNAVTIYPRASGSWGGDNATMFNLNDLPGGDFVAGTSYAVRFGVLELYGEDAYYVYVKVNGSTWYEKTITTGITNGHGLFLYPAGGAANTGAGVCSSDEYANYKDFDVLHNSDWTVTGFWGSKYSGTMQSSYSIYAADKLNFTPSDGNETASFIWKHQYTHTTTPNNSNYPIYLFARNNTGNWGTVQDADNIVNYYQGYEVGKTYDIEFGVLQRKDYVANEYDVFIKVDGEYKYGPVKVTRRCPNSSNLCTCNDPANHTGLWVYASQGGAGTCIQAAYKVEVDGTTYEVPAGKALGSALVTYKDAPAGYVYAGGWHDQDGNPVTKETVVNSDLVVSPNLEEVVEYEYYDVLSNADWTGKKSSVSGSFDGTMPDEWTMTNGQFLNFTPSAQNTTASFVWQFQYKHTAASGANGQMIIYPFATKAWGSDIWLDYESAGFNVGTTYDVEICVLKRKGTPVNEGYDAFIKVNGVTKVTKKNITRVCTNRDANCNCGKPENHTGVHISLQNSHGTGVLTSYSPYETYDVLTNADWKFDGKDVAMPNDWTLANDTYINFTPSTENTSGSFIWQFDYKCINATDPVIIYPRAGGAWGGSDYTYFDLNNLSAAKKFTKDGSYKIELGVQKLKGQAAYYVSVKVNEELWYEETITEDIANGNGLYFYTQEDAVRTGAGVCSDGYGYGDYEYFDVLYNSDWTINDAANTADEGPMGSTWTMTGAKNLMFEPSDQNKTGSFIWKYKYTHNEYNGRNDLAVFPFSTRIWTGVETYMKFQDYGFEVGKTYDVELGVLKRKGSQDNVYEIFVKVDGKYVYSPTEWTRYCREACGCNDVTKHIGLHVYFLDYGSGTCTQPQTMYTVDVDGNRYEVAPNGTMGCALAAFNGPKGYTITGWKDQNGNAFTKTTPVNSDLTLTPIYSYNYTIKDEAGAELTSGTHVYGETVAYDASALTTGTEVMIGYEVGNDLYKDLTSSVTACAAARSSVVAKTITLHTLEGASIRLGSKMSIRFTAGIDQGDSEYVAIEDFGILIATDAARKELKGFTIENLDAAGATYRTVHKNQTGGLKYGLQEEYQNQYLYSVVFDTLSMANSGTAYAARAYAQIKYADVEEPVYVYGTFDSSENVRSMYEVAGEAIADAGEGYSDKDKTSMQTYIDAVVDLNSALTLQGTRNYTVEVSEPSGGYYTITVTPFNEFNIMNLGCVIVNGQRMTITGAKLEAMTFQIDEVATAEAAASSVLNILDGKEADRDLLINAYNGAQLGLKLNKNNQYVDSGYRLTLTDLKHYMEAGFNAWRIEAGAEQDIIKDDYKPSGTIYAYDGIVYDSHDGYDIYRALDLAAQYAYETGKPCPVYINLTNLTDIDILTNEYADDAIRDAYSIFTNYDDGITGRNGVPGSVIGKKNQIAGFLLRDEPKWSQYDAFAATYKFIAYDLDAIEEGYDFSVALLQTYTDKANLTGTGNESGDYATYVKKYADLLEDTTLAFNNYPFYYRKSVNKEQRWLGKDWFNDMQTIRAQGNGYGTCIQSYTAGKTKSGFVGQNTEYKEIQSESQIAMQVYTALAYGFTNLDYFTYTDRIDYDYQVNAEIYQKVPVMWNDYDDWTKGYTTTDMYTWVQNTNAEATNLYDVLGKFTSQGVQLVKGSTTNAVFGNATSTLASGKQIGVTSIYDMVVGGFECGDLNGYLAVNVDYPSSGGRTTSATFTLGPEYSTALVYVNGSATLKAINNGQLTMSIGAGEGVFIVPFN